MKARTLTALISLVSIICALSACGNSGGSGSAATPVATLAKDAIVTVSFDPGNTAGKSYRISSSTNYIQLYVTQWQAGDLNMLTIINQDTSHTLTAGSPSATLTLYPTYTRICASQYSSTPSSSTSPLEASCSFGILSTGNNTVTLTMLNGQWTLSKAFNSVGSFVLSYPNTTAAKTGSVSYGVYDGNTSNFTGNTLPAQSINNWASQYQLQLKDGSGNVVTGLNTSAYANSFFSYGDSGPSFAAYGRTKSSTGKTSVAIGGFGRGVDSDGWIRETKSVIDYPLNSNIPVIAYPSSAVKVEDNSGNNVTSTILANCKLQVLSGSSLQGCGIVQITNNDGTVNSNSDIQKGAPTKYNYKVTSTASVAGADICYLNNASAARDSSNDVICYDYDYFTTSSGTACPAGGSYKNGRCEYTLKAVCTNNVHSGHLRSNTVYDATAQSCTATSVDYYLTLNSTALTLTAN